MIRYVYGFLLVALLVVGVGTSGLLVVRAQQMPGMGSEGTARPGTKEKHDEHGTPQGWKFTWPKGDPVQGREVFVKLECYSCHEVRGEKFPSPTEKGKVGPELSAMGPLHEPEYFAEAVINPSAVIDKGKGYEAEDGSSKMPSFNDSVTVQEVVDLVSYLRGLKPPAGAHGMPGMTGPGGPTRPMNH